jgi:hypothetical protein
LGKTQKAKDFRAFVRKHGTFEMLPSAAFKESGTITQTGLITLTTAPNAFMYEPHQGVETFTIWKIIAYINHSFTREEKRNGVTIRNLQEITSNYAEKVDCTKVSDEDFEKHYNFYKKIIDEILDFWVVLEDQPIDPTPADIDEIIKDLFSVTLEIHNHKVEEREDNWEEEYGKYHRWDCTDAPTHRAFGEKIKTFFAEKAAKRQKKVVMPKTLPTTFGVGDKVFNKAFLTKGEIKSFKAIEEANERPENVWKVHFDKQLGATPILESQIEHLDKFDEWKGLDMVERLVKFASQQTEAPPSVSERVKNELSKLKMELDKH